MFYPAVKIARTARGISGTARALAFDLAVYADAQGAVKVSQQRLAEDLDIDTRRVRKLVGELVNKGILNATRDGYGRQAIVTYQFAENAATGDLNRNNRNEAKCDLNNSHESGQKMRSKTSKESGHRWPPEVNNKQDKQENTPRACDAEPIEEEAQAQAGGETERLWHEVLARLKLAIDPESFATWFEGVECRELSAAGVVLVAPTDFFRRWILNNFYEAVTGAARSALGIEDAPELFIRVFVEPETEVDEPTCKVINAY